MIENVLIYAKNTGDDIIHTESIKFAFKGRNFRGFRGWTIFARFRGKKFSRIFADFPKIREIRENFFRENFFPRKFLAAKISAFKVFE